MLALRLSLFIAVFALLCGPALAQLDVSLAPVENAFWSHAPFEIGTCDLCHVSADPKDPGDITMPVNDLCLGCHEQIAEMLDNMSTAHDPVAEDCTQCHNPHNSERRMLLVLEGKNLCFSCHTDIEKTTMESKVQHDVIVHEKACMNCHNPHATNVEYLLQDLPYNLCVNCHGTDTMQDDQGGDLSNFKTLIDEGYMLHGPVASNDCSSCHHTHGGDNFRLLTEKYPAKFYAPYDRVNYELCFKCHEEERFLQPQTKTLTGFRDGDVNMHYLHVNKSDRGRTCRACHEVHAAPQAHIIRDGVPYGSSGWTLKINFVQEPNGGTCAKTCHSAKSYDRTAS